MALKVGIIGGAGRMGSYFADVFSNANYDVLVSDINEEKLMQMKAKGYEVLGSEELASKCDLVVFSVPIVETPGIVRKYAPLVKGSGKGISDLTSTKVQPVQAMLDASNPEVEVIGMHPMFAPKVSMAGQNVVLVPVRPEQGGVWRKRLEEIIEGNGASYFHATPDEHDYYMALVQGLPHAIQFIAADTFRSLSVDLQHLSQFSSKFYDMFFDVLWRVFAMDNPELYGQIQMGNPDNQRVLEAMEKAVRRHLNLITEGTMDDFSKIYTQNRGFLGVYAELAEQRTTPLVGKPVGVPIYYDRDDKITIESALGETLPATPYKEWLYTNHVSQGTLMRIRENFPFASYTVYKRAEMVGSTKIQRKEGTYVFYVSNRKHLEEGGKRIVFSPIVPLEPEKETLRHPHHVRIQMRNTYSDPWLNLFQTWREHQELRPLGVLIAGQTKYLKE